MKTPKSPAMPPTDAQFEAIAKLFAVVAEPTRLRILHALESGPCSVSQLVERLGTTQANTSKHLAMLSDRGLVKGTRDGMFMRYAISDTMVFDLCRIVCGKLLRDGQVAQQSIETLHHYTKGTAYRPSESHPKRSSRVSLK